MFDSVRYWRQVDATVAGIADEWPHIVGVDDPSRGLSVGCPVQVSREEAAKAIVENRGRLATADEIEAEKVRAKTLNDRHRELDRENLLRNMLFPPTASSEKKK